jgi:hypothetical protein
MRFRSICILLIALVATAFAQTTSRLEGNVTDSQGAAVVGAQITVVNTATGQTFELKSDERGFWAFPSMSTGLYTVTVALQGFKTEKLDNIKIDAGVPATANAVLQVGSLTETVEVTGGAEILQTASATVQSTLIGRQLHELPFTSRNITELIVTQPGSVTPGVPRSTSVYGLPQSALNTTLDGLNIQDNSNRSSDGFFLGIFPRADAIEEMTVVAAAAGADSNGEGAVQMKLVTKSGSNEWHGGLFEQTRNEMFDANYYFNTINRLPRDHVVFNQFGGLIGGPIKKNKAFFFVHMEALQLPQTYTEPTGTVLNPTATSGIFTYKDSSGNVVTKNLFAIAQANNLTSTPDPIVAKTLAQIQTLVAGQAGLASRIGTNNDYNRSNLDFQSKGGNYRRFPTVRLDYNLSQKNHVEFIYNYQTNLRAPDGINLGGSSPVFPGTGNVINGTEPGNQGGIAFSGVLAWRTTLSARLTNEVRGGLQGGTVIFNNGIGQPDFVQFGGYAPTFNYVTSPFRTTGQTRRNTPVKQLNDNLTYIRGAHVINTGFAFTQVNTWTTSANGTQFIPGVTFALAAGDPALNIFAAANLPGSSTAQQADAQNMYALLTGRVSSITRSVILDDATKKYGAFQPVVKNRQREIAGFVQDAWRVGKNLTLNYGIRIDLQNPPINLNAVYTHPGYAGLYGVSGVGNLFEPGVLTGQVPQYNLAADGETGYSLHPLYAPSFGLAYVVPKSNFKPLAMLLGREGGTVLRGGYAINSNREDGSTFSVWGGNLGRAVTLNVDPTNFPAQFGAPGSVLFRNPLPSRVAPTDPSFPLALVAGNSVSDYDPHLHTSYTQSWDFGIQRELNKDTVLEVRYIGNHGTGLWRNLNLNEVNIFENGFLNEFKIAQANLAIARQTNPTSVVYAGLAGQQPLPIITTAIGSNNDNTTGTQIAQGQAGALANAIANNATRMTRLVNSGKPVNFFQVNPLTGGNSTILTNAGQTHYQGMTVEVRRRMSKGILFQGSYTWSHSTSNEFSNGVAGNFTTLRNYALDNGPSPYDLRHALKLNWIYELPIGPSKQFFNGFQNAFAKKALQGWELASVARVQSGTPIRLTSGRLTANQNDDGVVLHNLTYSQLQDMVSIRKTTGSNGKGQVFFLPQSIIDNSIASFDLVAGKTVDTTQPYIGPPAAGQFGDRVFLYGPMQQKWDVSVVKRTYITEKTNFELRAQALNVFNLTNFLLFTPGSNITTTLAANSTAFGQTTGSYRDISNTNDTGGRIVEFVMRFNF